MKSQTILDRIKENIGRVIVGKSEAIELALIALVCGGHVLIEDVPGLGKTTLASCLAKSIGCSFGRIQFTPDLLPSDIVGFNMYDMSTNQRILCKGSIMHQLVLADEINRTSPKTQSALLEAMQEGQVTIDGQTIALPRPFMVMATQNPLEFSGTYPLPESQMDRFFLRIVMGYPTIDEELHILNRHQSPGALDTLEAVASAKEILALQNLLPKITVSSSIKQYIVDIASSSRAHDYIALPVSPRGSIALMRAAMGYALVHGRAYVLPDDVRHMAIPALAHRCVLYPAARAKGYHMEHILSEMIGHLPIPAAI